MGMQQTLLPLEMDRVATRAAVEHRLESVRMYKQIGFVRRETKLTSVYDARVHGATHAVGKPVEGAAVWNADYESRMEEQYNQVQHALSVLGQVERQVIERKYLTADSAFDYTVYSDLHISERKYYRVKSSALTKLALALRLEKYTE